MYMCDRGINFMIWVWNYFQQSGIFSIFILLGFGIFRFNGLGWVIITSAICGLSELLGTNITH
jgi:hypothetical protein